MTPTRSDRILPKTNLAKIELIKFAILVLISTTQAQIVSHELRRLAVATNQFGIDSLKALDEIEPPDKVLVFCPICLSSTLMMIMMGSSKYQVVSSLRHALYVWSMRPQEINRGFKDIFQHIGLNQNQQQPVRLHSATMLPAESRRSHQYAFTGNQMNDEMQPQPMSTLQHSMERSLLSHSKQFAKLESLSLPKLIRWKDMLESSARKGTPWWHSMSRRLDMDDYSRKGESVGFNQTNERNGRLVDPRDASDSSQMSAMCNIYIQRGLTMNYNYNLLLRQYYETVIHPVDFMKNTEETRQHINALVAANTENKIKDLVKRSLFDRKGTPKIMMISTFHFRGTLDIEMKARNMSTSKASASTSSPVTSSQRRKRSHRRLGKRQTASFKVKSSQFIETEPTLLKHGHFTSLDCSVIEIPFNNRLVTLVIVMPDRRNSTELLLTRLSAQILSDMINSLVVKKLSLEIPVIKFDRGPINTEGLLKQLGLDNLFFGNQTFSTETGLNRWMRASDILHETSIDIGTLNPNWGVPEDRLKVGAHESRAIEANHMRLDKPFFYFVMDSINSLILTMGRIRQ